LLQAHYLREKNVFIKRDKIKDEEILHSLGCSWTDRKPHIKIKRQIKSYMFKEYVD